MFSNPMFVQALRFLSGASLALTVAIMLLMSHCYLVGGRVPATVLGVFLCMTCQALMPLVGFALWGLLPARRSVSRSWRGEIENGRLGSRLGHGPEQAPSSLTFGD
ncbi:hypothetical protein RZS28_13835 [Methylocapsa polymorpha]|uniref:Uncharacterized protein n=1 Tax=Methylocapsa polymorpha TaxID=3080828 RepID=A0ABZ0HNK9_9HYPH|nr:hypothetical protein RZS28_13835 [Methylocapsa sp. RX1]